MTNQTDIIVIGGGVAGLSTAMQLGRRGLRVSVLERQRLGSGSTGRAAGLLGQLRGHREHTRMLMESVRIVQQLDREAGQQVYFQTGSLRLAATEQRAQEIADMIELGSAVGLEIGAMAIDEVAQRLPYMRTDDLLHACFCPTDGHLRPAELIETYVTLARRKDVVFHENCPVQTLHLHPGSAHEVVTHKGSFWAPIVVNAAGPWSMLIADAVDSRLPVAAVKHHYFVTQPDRQHPVDPMSPAVRDRHLGIYSRPERGGLLVGMYGSKPIGVEMHECPADFDMARMPHRAADYDLDWAIERARQRFPWISATTNLEVTTGIMTFTPDGRPLCGQLPDVDGLYHCAGFNGHGIVQSPAIGLIMAQLIVDGETTFDLAAIQADRFANADDLSDRSRIEQACHQMYVDYYGRVETASSA